MQHDFIIGFDPSDQLANFADHAGDIVPENMGQRNLDSRQTIAHPNVEMIQRAGAHFDQNFVCFDLGIGDFSDLQNLRPAVLFENDGFHSCSGKFCGLFAELKLI